MIVEFHLTPDDVIAFSRYHLAKSRPRVSGGTQRALVTFLITGSFATLIAIDALQERGGRVFVLLLGSLLVLGAILWLVSRFEGSMSEGRLRKMFHSREGQKALGQRRLTLTPTHLTVEAEEGTETIPWQDVRDVGVTEDYVFLYLGEEAVLIVPARAFSNEWHFEELVAKVKAYREQNHVGSHYPV